MSIEKYHSFGIFFEINKEKSCFISQYECSFNSNHFSSIIENKANFCPVCGSIVQKNKYTTDKCFLNVWEIEKESNIEQGTLFGTMENPKKELKYFSLNKNFDGVLNVDISDDYPCILSLDLDKTPKEHLNEAFKNKDFKKIVDKLEKTYNENFKIHFGIFTYII
jgi:hypothetical protein